MWPAVDSTARPEPALAPRQVPIRRLSVAEYHQLISAGILTEDDHLELLEGWLVAKASHDTWPAECELLERATQTECHSQPPPYPLWRFSVEDYHRMIVCGVFDENHRLELIQGWLVQKMTHSPLHDDTVEDLDELLRSLLPPGWRVRVQSAITTLDSEPEPDLAVVRRHREGRRAPHPAPHDIGLLIEVSDTTLSYDRGLKAETYAAAGIDQHWIVNLRDRQVEIFTQPSGPIDSPRYARTIVVKSGQSIELQLDGNVVAVIPVADLLS